jgi:hypothetical protein
VALVPLVGWISLFGYVKDEPASWPAVASIPATFFGVLALLLLEAYWERRGQSGAAAVAGRGAHQKHGDMLGA